MRVSMMTATLAAALAFMVGHGAVAAQDPAGAKDAAKAAIAEAEPSESTPRGHRLLFSRAAPGILHEQRRASVTRSR